MKNGVTEKGLVLLVRVWNENTKSTDNEVKYRAIEMLFNAFSSIEELLIFMRKHNIKINKDINFEK